MQRLSFLFKKPWFLPLLGLYIAVASCQSGADSSTTGKDPTTAEGEKLAQQYCSTCHSLVTPDALDKETWRKHALPAMAPKLGLEVWQQTHYYHPPSATISQENWTKLVAYYEKLAPRKARKSDSTDSVSQRLVYLQTGKTG
jgi:mono/diheme cytochrome c family protein